MKQTEIFAALKTGTTITVQENMRFKYGKLQQGTTTSYKCGDVTISSRQFDAIRDLLGRDIGELPSYREYKLKDF